MAGTKGKKQKGTFVERTVRRLDKIHAYENLATKVARWIKDETTESLKPALVELKAALDAAEVASTKVVDLFVGLETAKYVPPKKQFSGTIKLDKGKHVWIKPQHVGPYAKIYDQSILDNLHIVDNVGGKIVIAVGDPSVNPDVATFIAPKAILMANPPEVNAVVETVENVPAETTPAS